MRLLVSLLVSLAALASHAQPWTPQSSGTALVLGDVHFLNDATGFAVADEGLLLSTTDGGGTWSSRVLSAGLDNQGIAFNPSGTVGIIVTDDGAVWRTADGGATWTLVPTGMQDGRAAVAWGTDAVVWVAGRDADAAVSTDAGATWTYRSSGSAQRTEGMAAVGTQLAWVVNREGEIRHTANGGATWATQASGTTSDLKDIQMLNATTGYIAGSGNVVLKTTNGGATWTNVATSGVSGNGLFFLNATTGWVVADAGQIWFTSNAGASWALQPSGTTQSFNRVHFPSATRGFAVGDGGTVVRFGGATTAGGDGPEVGRATLAVAPNPTRGTSAVTLSLPEAGPVTVVVYDALGRRVALLHDGPLAAGGHRLEVGLDLTPGLFIIQAVTPHDSVARRLVVAQ